MPPSARFPSFDISDPAASTTSLRPSSLTVPKGPRILSSHRRTISASSDSLLPFPSSGVSTPVPGPQPKHMRNSSSTSILMNDSRYSLFELSSASRNSVATMDDRVIKTISSASLSTSEFPRLPPRYSLATDPQDWGTNLYTDTAEPDDGIHEPDSAIEEEKMLLNGKGLRDTSDVPRRVKGKQRSCCACSSWRGLQNIGCLVLLVLVLVSVFAIYPILSYTQRKKGNSNNNVIANNAATMRNLIDVDTPQEAYTIPSYNDPNAPNLQLVFSDEFNQEGRSFYPGDDPYWEAVDLHYWATNDLEWYDPSAITTRDGSLAITMSRAFPEFNHDLNFKSGLVSTWNKFCFTGGLIQTSVRLPGASNIVGFWPAIWTMGNLGRAGYGATLDGLWPYSYDSCDVGTLSNQTLNGLPKAATNSGLDGGTLSFVPGQRLSRCTCPGESHPGPVHADGSFVGRSAPEIDIIEAQTNGKKGSVSQSCQWAPFDQGYRYRNTSDVLTIYDTEVSELNSYRGGVYQEATSAVTDTNPECYELGDEPCFSVYGFEYRPGFDDGYITWIANDVASWTLLSTAMAGDDRVNISDRPIPQEPMYILMNLAMSFDFVNGNIEFSKLPLPASMLIDYVRVYQPPDAINIGCNPPDFPTTDYINTYIEAYTNPNLTTWVDDFHQKIPKNSLIDQC